MIASQLAVQENLHLIKFPVVPNDRKRLRVHQSSDSMGQTVARMNEFELLKRKIHICVVDDFSVFSLHCHIIKTAETN